MDKQREAFERHIEDCIASEVGLDRALVKDGFGDYCVPWVSSKWSAWQAAQAAQPAQVPVGWKLVPVEPTQAMQQAAMRAWSARNPIETVYKAMLSATPCAKESAQVPVAWVSESGAWVTTSKSVAEHHISKGQQMTPLYR